MKKINSYKILKTKNDDLSLSQLNIKNISIIIINFLLNKSKI